MRFIWSTFLSIALSNPAFSEECKILWSGLFLPPSEVEFSRTTSVNALLTLRNPSKPEPITFEMALTNGVSEKGEEVEFLSSTQTIVSGEITNIATLTLQPMNDFWLVAVDTVQILRPKSNRTASDNFLYLGFLHCNQLKPWSLKE